MLYKNLGNSQVKIPAIVQGTTGVGSYSNFNGEEIDKRIKVLRYGIDLGMNYLDTAEGEGKLVVVPAAQDLLL